MLIYGKNIDLRPVEIDDAEFILSLRIDPKLNQYLSPVENDLEKQKSINAVLTTNLETLIETVEAYNVKIVAMYRGLFNTVDYKE